MSGIYELPPSSITMNTLDRGDVGLSFRRRLKHEKEGKELPTPTKTVPAAKLYQDDQLPEEVKGANEFYKQLSLSDLRELSYEEGPIHIEGLEKQLRWSRDGDFDFTFLEYDETIQISRIEAYKLVQILEQSSDYLTVPLQPRLYREINSDNGLDDFWYTLYKDGIELFLRACHDSDTNKPIMGAIPPLDLQYVEDLINLYEMYDVFAFYIDFDWTLSTRPNQVARSRTLMRRIANQRHHEDILIYAINARRGKLDRELGYYPAADFATLMMGVDIIGGNYSGPNWPPEVFEDMETDDGFNLFLRDISGYIRPPINKIDSHAPEETDIDIEDLKEKSMGSDQAQRRFEKLINAEQMGLELVEFRSALEEGTTPEFIHERHMASEILNAGEAVREAFEQGFQSTIGDFT